MKNYTYRVYFENGFSSTVIAGCESAAIILAQARQIKAGRNWDVTEVKQINTYSA